MDDGFGNILAIIFTVVAMTLLPLISITQKMENVTQSVVENAVVRFVDKSRATGKIEEINYEEMCSSIGHYLESGNVQITHSCKVAYPTDNGDMEYAWFDSNQYDVLKVLYAGETYKMRNGDYLSVRVYNTQPTMATRMMRFIYPSYNPNNTSVFVEYGGLVGNNP